MYVYINVTIFRRFDLDEEETTSVQVRYIKQFKEELMNYKKTRHDNVELFLGEKFFLRIFYELFQVPVWNHQVWQLWRETIAAGG